MNIVINDDFSPTLKVVNVHFFQFRFYLLLFTSHFNIVLLVLFVRVFFYVMVEKKS